MKENEVPITLNEHAVESMLSYGFLSADFTYANEIKRLYPGHYFIYQDGNTIEKMLVITAISAINYYFGGNTKDVN